MKKQISKPQTREITAEEAAAFKAALVNPTSAESHRCLKGALRSDYLRVKTAAEIIRDNMIGELDDDLEQALDRLMGESYQSDPGCPAKISAADALYHLGTGKFPLWQRVIRYVQMEPVWGKSIDTAANLRGIAALAIVQTGEPLAPFEVVQLLTDSEAQARCFAASALGELGSTAAELVLRHKALTGDPEAAVTGDVLDALARAAPQRSTDFIAAFLTDGNEQIREAAAVALAQTHLENAFEIVKDAWDKSSRPAERRALVRGIALFRSDDAFCLLMEAVKKDDSGVSAAAVSGLFLYAGDPAREREIKTAVGIRNDPKLTAHYRNVFL